MPLEEYLAANREFLSKGEGAPASGAAVGGPARAPREPQRRLALVTCMDGRLTKLVPPAVGIERGDALMIRTAGNVILPHDQAILRSLAVGVYMLGVEEVLVIGHTDCRMAGDVLPLLDGMSKRGVSRDVLGSADVRETFGFIPNPESNVRATVAQIRQSPLIASSVKVYGLMIDTDTGAVRVVIGEEREAAAAPTFQAPTEDAPVDVVPYAEEEAPRPVRPPQPQPRAAAPPRKGTIPVVIRKR